MTNEFQIEIIKQKFGNSEEFSVSARELHKVLEVKDRFATWITRRINKYEFEENVDYISLSQNRETQRKDGRIGIAVSTEYFLTIGTAKELAMVENNEKGRKVRKYFIKVEKEYLKLITDKFPKGALLDWNQSRINGKTNRRGLTDTIKEFIVYAEKQGSRNANRYYSNITVTTYKALELIEKAGDIGDNFRDTLNAIHLQFLGTAENIALEIFEDEMKKDTPYKEIFQIAKKKIIEFATVIIPVLELKPRERIEVIDGQGVFEF